MGNLTVVGLICMEECSQNRNGWSTAGKIHSSLLFYGNGAFGVVVACDFSMKKGRRAVGDLILLLGIVAVLFE